MAELLHNGQEDRIVEAYCDASVKDNALGGCAWAIEDRAGGRGFYGRVIALGRVWDTIAAEMHAIRAVMEYLVERAEIDGYRVGNEIVIYTDCKSARRMVYGWQALGAGEAGALRAEAFEAIMALEPRLYDCGIHAPIV